MQFTVDVGIAVSEQKIGTCSSFIIINIININIIMTSLGPSWAFLALVSAPSMTSLGPSWAFFRRPEDVFGSLHGQSWALKKN